MNQSPIDELIASQQPGHALQQGFYRSAEIFEKEMQRIFLKSWLYVGHHSQVPEIGDFFVFHIAGESIIIVRSADDQINALINVCRHRGSRVCLEEQGNAARFVCPYHAWTYDLEGNLKGAPQVMDTIDISKYPLRCVKLENFHGMVFINFDESADFELIVADLDAPLAPYDIANTKIAHRQNYPIDSNWKLAVENLCECDHCIPAHPEFAVGHGGARPKEKVADLKKAVISRANACGLTSEMLDVSWDTSQPIGLDRDFDRYPLLKGHVTGSPDGKPVAPLLGTIKDYDGGATDLQIGPVSYGLLYCDHVVLYRFTPTAIDATDCEVTWLVRDSAVEGQDYKLDDLIWLWDVTTIADKRIIQNNQCGVNSRFFVPGPFTPMEAYTQRFTEWYLDIINE